MENFHSSCWILVRLQKTSATIFCFIYLLLIPYPEAIRVEEENGEEIEVMDLLFFYDRKKLDEDAIRERINFFASETKCEVRVVVIKIDDVPQQEEIR